MNGSATPGQEMTGYCGLDCRTCPIHVATLEVDAWKRRTIRTEISRVLKERYSLAIDADDIGDCDGCRSDKVFVTCAACGIRSCIRGKNLSSCAYCDQYACEPLQKIFTEDPAACNRLEELRKVRE